MKIEGRWLALAAVLGMLVQGCASKRDQDLTPQLWTGFMAPTPPAFLSGHMAPLLTNQAGFTGVASLREGTNKTDYITGKLYGNGTTLLFAPESGQVMTDAFRAANLSFIWDVSQNRGFLLSEALQAYAPMSLSLRCTNLMQGIPAPSLERVDGHPCELQLVTVDASDGSRTTLHAWRATDLNNLPVRITAQGSTASQFELIKVRQGSQPPEIFKVPDGFTRYENAETLMGELSMRRHGLKRYMR